MVRSRRNPASPGRGHYQDKIQRRNRETQNPQSRRDQRAFRSASRFAGRPPFPSRPRPFRFAASALVTSDIRPTRLMIGGFRLPLAGGVALRLRFATRSIPPFASLPARRPQTESPSRTISTIFGLARMMEQTTWTTCEGAIPLLTIMEFRKYSETGRRRFLVCRSTVTS